MGLLDREWSNPHLVVAEETAAHLNMAIADIDATAVFSATEVSWCQKKIELLFF